MLVLQLKIDGWPSDALFGRRRRVVVGEEVEDREQSSVGHSESGCIQSRMYSQTQPS